MEEAILKCKKCGKVTDEEHPYIYGKCESCELKFYEECERQEDEDHYLYRNA